jgi:hypothetical protein
MMAACAPRRLFPALFAIFVFLLNPNPQVFAKGKIDWKPDATALPGAVIIP